MTLSVPTGLWDKYYEACNFFIEELGRDATIMYPAKKTACSNCIKPVGMDYNVYRHGGPAPFSFGNCPLCGGSGYKETEHTDTIKLRTYWNRADWIRIVGNIVDKEADILVIGYMLDVEKVKQADYIILCKDNNEASYRAKLVGPPRPWGFKRNKYFFVTMK